MKTKNKYYAVLWIPTKTHEQVIEHPIQTTITRNISDIEGVDLNIEVALQQNYNIDISILDKSGEKEFFIRLTHVFHSRNGLIEYSYYEKYYDENNPKGFRFTSDTFPEAVYHIIKEFYHKHEFHDEENDTSLSPFICNQPIDLKENDNLALKHYLERYEKALTDLVKYTQKARECITKKHKVKNYYSFGKLILKAKGYEVYLNALYDSIYNTKCKLGICSRESSNSNQNEQSTEGPQTDQEQSDNLKDMRRRAFNIENLINYFNACGQEYNINVQQHNLMEQIRNTWYALVITFVSTIFSIGITIYYAFRSTDDLQIAKDEITNTIETKIDSVKNWINSPSKAQTDGVKSDKTAKQTNQSVEKKSK